MPWASPCRLVRDRRRHCIRADRCALTVRRNDCGRCGRQGKSARACRLSDRIRCWAAGQWLKTTVRAQRRCTWSMHRPEPCAYRKDGHFPDGTVLVKEVFKTTTKDMTIGTVSSAGTLAGPRPLTLDVERAFHETNDRGELSQVAEAVRSFLDERCVSKGDSPVLVEVYSSSGSRIKT